MKTSPLVIIALLFAGAFAGRIVGMANASMSRESAPATEPAFEEPVAPQQLALYDAPAEEPVPALAKPAPAKPAAKTEKPRVSATLAGDRGALLAAIRDRAAALDEREAEVEDRIRVLEALEKRIEEKVVELRASHDDLARLVSYANEASEQDIALLARMYEQMKPAKAGEIFDQMNPTFAAGFLTQMNAESAALILANMSTDKAYEASMIIASRNAAVRQQ